MSLTDAKARNAKPKDKPYRVADGGGMYLEIMPTGSMYWRWKYRFDGKEKRLALGVYPEVTLAAARLNRDTQRKLLKEKGSDPLQARREEKIAAKVRAGNTFDAVARLWWDHWKGVRSARHADYVLRRLDADIFPVLGGKPLAEITAPQLLAVIRTIEKRGALDIAKRALQTCGQIFRYGLRTDSANATRWPTSSRKTPSSRAANKTTSACQQSSSRNCCARSRFTMGRSLLA